MSLFALRFLFFDDFVDRSDILNFAVWYLFLGLLDVLDPLPRRLGAKPPLDFGWLDGHQTSQGRPTSSKSVIYNNP